MYLVAIDYGDDLPPFGAPDRLVEKRSGELREVYGMLRRDPVPNLRPIGNPPG